VRALLAAGARPDAATAGGATALMAAVGWGKAEHVKLLLAAGADPFIADEDGTTAIDQAAAHTDTKGLAVQKLLAAAVAARPGAAVHKAAEIREAVKPTGWCEGNSQLP
jgi:ankyrin repeat protein